MCQTKVMLQFCKHEMTHSQDGLSKHWLPEGMLHLEERAVLQKWDLGLLDLHSNLNDMICKIHMRSVSCETTNIVVQFSDNGILHRCLCRQVLHRWEAEPRRNHISPKARSVVHGSSPLLCKNPRCQKQNFQTTHHHCTVKERTQREQRCVCVCNGMPALI